MRLTAITGSEVFVNRRNIECFKPAQDGGTVIYTLSGSQLYVKEDFNEVVSRFTDTGIPVEFKEFR